MTALRHFIDNRFDALYPLSGRPLHKDCFEAHPLRERAIRFNNERIEKTKRECRICHICGKLIDSDWFSLGLISSDPSSPLFEFNHLHFHRSELAHWNELGRFQRILRESVEKHLYSGSLETEPFFSSSS